MAPKRVFCGKKRNVDSDNKTSLPNRQRLSLEPVGGQSRETLTSNSNGRSLCTREAIGRNDRPVQFSKHITYLFIEASARIPKMESGK